MTRPLNEVLAALDALAPLSLAESWDNVGLLLPGVDGAMIGSALFAIDLTRAVTEEALALGVDLVIAYHPPIFKGLTRLRRSVPLERSLLELIERGVALYSPHTALDSAPRGLNDWLVGLAGAGKVAPIAPLPADPSAGAGRVSALAEPTSAAVLAERITRGAGAPHGRIADRTPDAPVQFVAVAAGAGGSLFEHVHASGRTLFVSGELRHHDVLAFVERGHAVLLLEHDASERGFLGEYAARLEAAIPTVAARVARTDQSLVRALG